MAEKCPRCESSNVSYLEPSGKMAATGMVAGAAMGSVLPVIGTAAGALTGMIGGLLGDLKGANRKCVKCDCEFRV
jgi:hypothetical protein